MSKLTIYMVWINQGWETRIWSPCPMGNMSDLSIEVGEMTLSASWTDDAPETRAAIEATLPISGAATRWGDELYFGTSVDVGAENARAAVQEGAVAYWPQGNALCLFWGPTPASDGSEPRAASPVNVVARLSAPERLASLTGDARVRIEKA